ncbi:MAG: 4Fe-4S cluster-binding domain-containing protein [bacterium]|nr:4Fe-4S cluster-binding domain-containing protein [bacterium]
MYNKKQIEMIELHVTDHCNLNCKSCMHFSPLACNEFVKLKDFKQDLKTLAFVGREAIKEIHILGGEPLLHPQLLKMLKLTRHYFPNSLIKLISNGILVAKQKDEFWRTLNRLDIELSITEYPLDINYKEINRLVQYYDVKYNFYAPSKENSQWHFPLDLDGSQDPEYSFANCSKGNNCTNVNIYKGKLFLCPITAYINYFNKYFNKNLEIASSDYLILKNIKNINEINEFISAPTPFCKYCDIDNRTFNNKWEVSKKDINEWT